MKYKFNRKQWQLISVIGSVLFVIAISLSAMGILMAISHTTISPIAIVSSESMEPALNRGDIIFIEYKDPADIKNGTIEGKDGDIIVFDPNGVWEYNLPPNHALVVHRVVGKMYNETDGKYYFLTKGDNNPRVDPQFGNGTWLPEDHVHGVVTYVIPRVGIIVLWLRDPVIFIPLLVILGIVYIASKIYDKNFKNEEEKIVCEWKDISIGNLTIEYETNCKPLIDKNES